MSALGVAAPCPCGSARTLGACCGPYVVDGLPAPTAEALMRSRYTAYVLGALDHLFRTWHPRTRPAEVPLPLNTSWTRLEIRDVVAGQPGDETGEVEFVARWASGDQNGVMHERSTFARRGGRWVYVAAVAP